MRPEREARVSEKIDLSNQTLDCGCVCCGRRFEYNYGRAAQEKSVTCPACGHVIEAGEQLSRIEREVESMVDDRPGKPA